MSEKILVTLAESRAAESTLRVADEAARALPEAGIEVLHVRVDPSAQIIAADEVLTQAHREALELEAAEEGARLKHVFDTWQAARGHPAPPATWLDVASTVPEEVARHARDAALVVTGKLAPDSRGHARAAFTAALFKARRPLLVVPRRHAGGFGQDLVIGWKEGDAAERAVSAALPWLRLARVTVVRVHDNPDEDLAGARRLLDSLGVAAAYRVVPFGGLSAGQRLLAEAERLGADGLVIGGFGRNRLIEWIFGGVTRDVMEEMRLPVLLRH